MTDQTQSTTENTGKEGLTISDSAAKRIIELLKEEQPGTKLRVSVAGGGCSGFQYVFDFDEEQNDDDLVFEHNGASVLVDSTSLDLVKGSVLDFVETLGESYFSVKNPNASANCGCGNSFSV